ncbi:MAG: fasciclin domain-containing protein [Pseudomonadota bacterium]
MKTLSIKTLFGASAFALIAACGGAETDDTAPVEAEAPVEVEEAVEEVAEVVEPEAPAEEPAAVGTIVEVAVGNPDFSTLVAAVQAAELVDTLNSAGPFTVFAPVNDAFAALPEGTVETLLLPENKADLQGVLTYHVVAGEVMAADVVAAITDGGGSFEATTVQGGTLTVSLDGENVILTDENGGTATVVATDVDASNGVIHVIDSVVLPGAGE